jgi:hypothetical protein
MGASLRPSTQRCQRFVSVYLKFGIASLENKNGQPAEPDWPQNKM